MLYSSSLIANIHGGQACIHLHSLLALFSFGVLATSETVCMPKCSMNKGETLTQERIDPLHFQKPELVKDSEVPNSKVVLIQIFL
jgi:hypothetical protein